jgi:predicted DNA-binding protein (UPF0251 family)
MTKTDQKEKLDKLSKILSGKPEIVERLLEYLELKTGIELIIKDINPKRFYKISELVKMLGLSRQTIYSLIESKTLKSTDLLSHQKIIGQDLINYLLKNENI